VSTESNEVIFMGWTDAWKRSEWAGMKTIFHPEIEVAAAGDGP
jgi:hypothetical protein